MLKGINLKKDILPHVGAVLLFIVLTFSYLNPMLEGKQLTSHDSIQSTANQKELQDYYQKTGEYALWTNSLFGGMPTFQISLRYTGNLMNKVIKVVRLGFDSPARQLFWYFMGVYIILNIFQFNIWICLLGAIAFGFSSYNIIILEAMHVTKGVAIGFMAGVLGGIVLCYNGRYLLGGSIAAFFGALELKANHYQITYYLLIMAIIYAIVQLIIAYKENRLKDYGIASLVLAVAAVLSLAPNIGKIWSTYEYGQSTIRGKSSELSTKKENLKQSGLDKDYALRWSYGPWETFTLLVPNMMGGSSTSSLDEESNTYQTLVDKGVPRNRANRFTQRIPLYHGPQPFTSGPVYFGATICFLFVLSLFVTKGPLKWWLLATTILSVLLAWGKHFQWFYDIFFNYLPFFDKFRTPSMILVLASLCFPILAAWAISNVIQKSNDQLLQYAKYALYITGGLCLFIALLGPAFISFSTKTDARFQQMAGQWLVDAIQQDREYLLRYDAFRSLLFVVAAFGLVWGYLKNKLQPRYLLIGLAAITLIDLWTVDRRYLSNEDFKSTQQIENQLRPNKADISILKQSGYKDFTTMNFNTDYRVFNISSNPFTDARTSYFHKSVGGYHAAKLRKYQEVIEYHLNGYFQKAKQLLQQKGVKQATHFLSQQPVLNMLNTRYFIMPKPQGRKKVKVARTNPNAIGSAWFVDSIAIMADADQEINSIAQFDPSHTALLRQDYQQYIQGLNLPANNRGTINQTNYSPNELTYKVNAPHEQFAVFSEVYYNNKKGWQAYIDNKPVRHCRVNYILRGLRIPKGQHTVTFKFEPRSYYIGNKIGLAGSIILLAITGFALIRELWRFNN